MDEILKGIETLIFSLCTQIEHLMQPTLQSPVHGTLSRVNGWREMEVVAQGEY